MNSINLSLMPVSVRKFSIEEIEYQVKYSTRRTLGISINPLTGVVARVPYRTPDRVIEKMIRDKSGWIRKILIYHSSLKKIDNRSGFKEGDKVLFLGKDHHLKIIQSPKHFVRRNGDNVIEVGTLDPGNQEIIRALLEKWYRISAKELFPLKLAEILNRYKDYKFSPTGFSVKVMKSRWGSCTSKGKISLSYDLIRLDVIYVEYVIIHELCHLKHHNHGESY